MKGPRWPLQPLLDVTGLTLNDLHKVVKGDPWVAARNGLSDAQADRWAVACRLHPVMAWPDWFDAALTLLDRQYLDGGWRQAWLWNETRDELGRAA